MNRQKRWDIFFQQHKCPCFITDVKTFDLLYYNEEFAKLFDVTENAVGKNFYDVIPLEDIFMEDPMPDWSKVEFFESETYNKRLNIRFLLRATLLRDENEVFCEMRPFQHDVSTNFKFEDAMARCIEIYGQPLETITQSFMELFCNFYHCEQAYVYHLNYAGKHINCISQWNDNPQNHVAERLEELVDFDYFIEFIETKAEAGVIRLDKDTFDFTNDPHAKTIFDALKSDCITFCVVEDSNNNTIGIIGVNNQEDNKQFFDRRLITTISRFVATEITKVNLDENLLMSHYRDSLTGLFNRVGYARRIDQIMTEKPKTMGVISVNINGLRFINENAGIAKGDEHIKKSAKRLVDHFEIEFFRMSGDEFLGVAVNVEEEEFEDLAISLHIKMREENNYDFSFGHTWGQYDLDILKLSAEADLLMYINKQQYYSESKRNFDSVTDTTLFDLMTAIENDEFCVYLQPQVLLEDASLYGAEALIRRFDPKTNNMISPGLFIPFYEQKSVIRHLDMFVFESVCKLERKWLDLGKHIPISVNFSRVTLQEYGIVKSIKSVCDRYNVPYDIIVIEVTERAGMLSDNVATSLIQEFKEYGFTISLDDFGCAYSNIVTLAQIEVDEVKIDKSLVDYIISNKKNLVLVKNILSMCNELEGISTLAEGIEDEEQGKLLHKIGCRLGQGYFYSRPISIEEFTKIYID